MTQPSRPADLLAEIVGLASQEGALTGDGLAAFLEALRARAQLVLAERTEPLENRLRALEAEAASLRAETAWRAECVATLEQNALALGQQVETLSDDLRKAKDAHAALLAHDEELQQSARALGLHADRLSGELQLAKDAHGSLLAHQLELVEQVAAELVSIAALSPLQVRQARRRLLHLAELVRGDAR